MLTSLSLAGDIKVKPMSNARSIHKTFPMIFACMNTDTIALELMHAYDTTDISHQTVCQKHLEKKAELATISRSSEDGQHHDDPSLGETGVKFQEGGEVDDQSKGDEEQLSPSNLRCTIGELGMLSKMENETRKLSCFIFHFTEN